MADVSSIVIPDRHAGGHLREAQRAMLFFVALGMVSWVVFQAGMWSFGPPRPGSGLQFPLAFAASTVLLAFGSLSMNRALSLVRLERQTDFRRWLVIAAIVAATFIGVQSYGLLWMTPATRSPEETSLGVRPFVLVLAGLHAMHFCVAMLFVSVVLSRSIADRYDHEYHWGVTACAWFWHLLGVAWVAILAVFAIAFGA
jgi:cytochrome c oxidase subunit III